MAGVAAGARQATAAATGRGPAPARAGGSATTPQATAAHRLQAYLDAFEDGGWATKGPAFVREMRREAIERLRSEGALPTPKPAWAHTNLRDAEATAFLPAHSPARVHEQELAAHRLPDAIELVFVDGHYSAALSHAQAPRGITVQPLSAALRNPSEDLESHLGRYAGDAGAVPLNTAFLQDGLFVSIPRGAVVEEPIHLLHVASDPASPATPTASHMRSLVLAGANSEALVVESYVGLPSPGPGLTTAVTELVAGEGARVRHAKLQCDNVHALHVGHLAIRQDRASTVHNHLMTVGAHLSRHDVDAVLGGEGAVLQLDGLFLGTGSQHVDCATRIEHAVPHTTSRELYKGVLDGAAHGVFLGDVRVAADAQKTNAAQTNRNLLLSERAAIDTTPQLEIHADDVKCSHGSTIGQLDKAALFFLRSRGLDQEAARLLLTRAFAHEALAGLPDALRSRFDTTFEQWFACRKVHGGA